MNKTHIKSAEIIIEQEGDCTYPIAIHCNKCPFKEQYCLNDAVVLVMAEEYLSNEENKKEKKMNEEMDENMFIAISFPDIQEYQELEGFEDNSILINNDSLLEEYGPSAYMVRCDWIYSKQGTPGEK